MSSDILVLKQITKIEFRVFQTNTLKWPDPFYHNIRHNTSAYKETSMTTDNRCKSRCQWWKPAEKQADEEKTKEGSGGLGLKQDKPENQTRDSMPILIILYQNKLIASLIPPIYFCVSDPHIPLEAWIIQKVQVSSPRLTRSDPDPGQGTDQGQGLGLPKKKMRTHKSIAPFYGDLAWPAFANSMETPGELMRISI